MKRVWALGVIFVLMRLFWLFNHPLIICADEDIKLKFEPIEEQMSIDYEYPPEEIFEEEYETGIIFKANTIDVDYDDAQMLMKIAMAEAEGDGVEGKAMVMAVVLNRVNDDRFPNTIEEVIFQEHQFSPISDGRYYEAVPDNECHLALAEIEKGNYVDVEALYFENAKQSWQQSNCEYLYTIGHHRFYKN